MKLGLGQTKLDIG